MTTESAVTSEQKPLNANMTSVMVGASMMGSITASNVVQLLSGQMDEAIGVFLYYKEKGSVPVYDTDLVEISPLLDKLKDYFRAQVQGIFAAAELQQLREEDAQRKAEAHAHRQATMKAAAQFKSMSKPASEGTVDELATKYGVSKSHIRMLKREGRLSELTEAQASA